MHHMILLGRGQMQEANHTLLQKLAMGSFFPGTPVYCSKTESILKTFSSWSGAKFPQRASEIKQLTKGAKLRGRGIFLAAPRVTSQLPLEDKPPRQPNKSPQKQRARGLLIPSHPLPKNHKALSSQTAGSRDYRQHSRGDSLGEAPWSWCAPHPGWQFPSEITQLLLKLYVASPHLKELLNVMITRKLLTEKSLCTENFSSFFLLFPLQSSSLFNTSITPHLKRKSLQQRGWGPLLTRKALRDFGECVHYLLLYNKSPPKPSCLKH